MQSSLPYEEKELLTRIAEGDATIYPYLHDTYYNSLVYFSLSIIPDQQQAEDIAVDSLVKLWQLPTHFETTGKLKSYLFTLVRNASLNYLKHLRVRERSESTLSGTDVLVDSRMEALIVESDLMRLVHQEIARLPASYREVVELLYIEDLSSAEAAEKLGISMENLRQRKGRAIKELKNELLRKGFSELLLSVLFF
ncbi:RNA polymerase sigma factor [Chitinophaga arvensicola]|uniref:RNA polymerase sigma-70 factor, ECF subfamily n=1 Tax=Chitinophaga arvensicola TaxID=29529 RepID=A0A1I0RAV3_9BACT|nr:sigma-70 family RNA polymerase sigma factor [Chitinophaga arvensicola]SEW37723.1 RNA polymerase sigma-70 factor, ECF subfamily [Chitinophaga arvensicola]